MIVVLNRHGLTMGNLNKVYLGGVSDEPLCAAGVAALEAQPCLPAVRKVYTSGLLRTRQSAAIRYPRAAQIAVADLREMEFGRFEGHNWRDLYADVDYRVWVDGGCLGRCPGGEDRAAFVARCRAAFLAIVADELALGAPELHLLVHGGTIMALLSEFAWPRADFYAYHTPAGGSWRCMLDAAEWLKRPQLQISARPQGATA